MLSCLQGDDGVGSYDGRGGDDVDGYGFAPCHLQELLITPPHPNPSTEALHGRNSDLRRDGSAETRNPRNL